MPEAQPRKTLTAANARRRIREAYREDENAVLQRVLPRARLAEPATVSAHARQLAAGIVTGKARESGIQALMQEYDLSTQEGIALMCLAEALLRVPDGDTADRLIRDKLGAANWERHLGPGKRLFVNASTWGLLLGERMADRGEGQQRRLANSLRRMVSRLGEPLLRTAVTRAIRLLGGTFVLGRSIHEALRTAREAQREGYRHSYDMLGEAARTQADADAYFAAYRTAIAAIGKAAGAAVHIDARPGISVKLSALHPRYEFAKTARIQAQLLPRIRQLCLDAKDHNIGLCIDAEEADRLEPSLDIVDALAGDPALHDWQGLGIVVQAYQKRALPLLDWLIDLATHHQRRLMIRLVKGAYWDTEIKDTQVRGLDDYPVFTRKSATDASYLACARRLLEARATVYPMFATHNAHSVAAVLALAGDTRDGFEFQRLHGMGETLYDQIVGPMNLNIPCRIYAPVGTHEDLLAYLVRRLLENGANSSFVNRIAHGGNALDELVADPVEALERAAGLRNQRIALPAGLYAPMRRNSRGLDLSDPLCLEELNRGLQAALRRDWSAHPLIGGRAIDGEARTVTDPADRRRRVGQSVWARPEQAEAALATAHAAFPGWAATPAEQRAACLERIADAYEAHTHDFMALCTREAGKTLADGIAEVREAVDFCRYYAAQARRLFAEPETMPGPTGEHNALSLHGRGVFVCISPWNFPLAIFTGQVVAALAAGNAVIAKPAEQTTLIAALAVRLMHEAGIPPGVLNLLPGDGATLGPTLVSDRRTAGIAFTGSTETAWLINRGLAERRGPIVPLIAETGGQNAMIVDSTALPEQVVRDAVQSAFYSAGQRCSALRVIYLQQDIAERVTTMLRGALAELDIGDPALLATDVGPVIDTDARDTLEAHASKMTAAGRLIARAQLPGDTAHGTFVAPALFRIDSIKELEREVFGPMLHIAHWRAGELDRVVDDINATGYGLTLGVHSRIDETVERVVKRARAGNIYVNRNMIGAVVGTQPFGGEGLSGTGFKAGGPHYLLRFSTERVVAVDTTAAGGNASLFALD
ncbi:bifunctional proline dehydrogenase/L-glutamate gamma-semialdehyde dehydrogenase PutA [Acidihalobacter ferrooxydans]|uniref:Bifunctional protein PutA n=1 Tax=Acidihalobacter ferrooxydans TaxID=1765967 RepID=A0A1P8UHY9_9GAMM|nr:bifunctional proline dehydrogenase/L-glutamate gamma-semialdehyde dehydrogenase PutA [Acidihalobacter ferrooxydans]APZ43465.1 bifunctional proline dehydrogenase/L-glutamate gamma-semialdehyde dehydrogenase [Acidihalobacter ferrooxydans]